MRVAAKVRLEKEKHPERFCSNKNCLWRTATPSGTPCPKHSLRCEGCGERGSEEWFRSHTHPNPFEGNRIL